MLTFNLQKYDLENAKLMLDVGCGEGRHIFGVMQEFPDIKCIGIDMDATSLIAEEGYEYFKSYQKKVEFLKGSAYDCLLVMSDLVICSEVLEHLHDYDKAILEIYRVLKPKGKFYAKTTPSSWQRKYAGLFRDYQNQPGGHFRSLTKRFSQRN